MVSRINKNRSSAEIQAQMKANLAGARSNNQRLGIPSPGSTATKQYGDVGTVSSSGATFGSGSSTPSIYSRVSALAGDAMKAKARSLSPTTTVDFGGAPTSSTGAFQLDRRTGMEELNRPEGQLYFGRDRPQVTAPEQSNVQRSLSAPTDQQAQLRSMGTQGSLIPSTFDPTVSAQLGSPAARSLGATPFVRTGATLGQGESQAATAAQLKAMGIDTSVGIGENQQILNKFGRENKIKEEMAGPTDGEFYRQFNIPRPTPKFDENGNFVGLNDPTGISGLDQAYGQLFASRDPNAQALARENIRLGQTSILGQTPEGQAFLEQQAGLMGIRADELTRSDQNLMNSLSGGSQIGSQIENQNDLSLQAFFEEQRNFLQESLDNQLSAYQEQRNSNTQQANAEKARLDKEMREAVSARLTREGFGGGYAGDLTTSQKQRIADVERQVKEEYEAYKTQVDDNLRVANREIDSLVAGSQKEFSNSVFALNNELFSTEYKAKQEKSSGDLDYQRDLQKMQMDFQQDQLSRQQSFANEKEKAVFIANLEEQLENTFGMKDLAAELAEIDNMTDPNLAQARLSALQMQLDRNGINADISSVAEAVVGNKTAMLELEKRNAQSLIASRGSSRTGSSGISGDMAVASVFSQSQLTKALSDKNYAKSLGITSTQAADALAYQLETGISPQGFSEEASTGGGFGGVARTGGGAVAGAIGGNLLKAVPGIKRIPKLGVAGAAAGALGGFLFGGDSGEVSQEVDIDALLDQYEQ